MVAAVLCCLPLLAATVIVYSVPGSRSVRVVVVMSLGTVSWNRKNKTRKFKLRATTRYRFSKMVQSLVRS